MYFLDMSVSLHLSLTRRTCRVSTWCFSSVSSCFHLINHLISPSQNTLPQHIERVLPKLGTLSMGTTPASLQTAE